MHQAKLTDTSCQIGCTVPADCCGDRILLAAGAASRDLHQPNIWQGALCVVWCMPAGLPQHSSQKMTAWEPVSHWGVAGDHSWPGTLDLWFVIRLSSHWRLVCRTSAGQPGGRTWRAGTPVCEDWGSTWANPPCDSPYKEILAPPKFQIPHYSVLVIQETSLCIDLPGAAVNGQLTYAKPFG